MSFRHKIEIALCLMLYCLFTLPANAANAEDKYYRVWKLEYSGYQLEWYYNTIEDHYANQPNMVIAHDKKFIIQPKVRPPTINSIYLLEHSKVNEGEEVLDIGTGSGIHAVFAAEKAKRVVATDIFEPSVENARLNAKLHGVESKIDFRVGDLFEPIEDGEKFDVFFININFPNNPDASKRNNLHERLFSQIRHYMKPGARIYYQTSFIRNLPYILDMLKRNKLRVVELHMEHMYPYGHEPLFFTLTTVFLD